MKIGWVAVAALLAAAGGVGWFVLQQDAGAPATAERPAATATAPQRASFNAGAPLTPELTTIAQRVNAAAFDPNLPTLPVIDRPANATTSATTASATPPADGAGSATEGRGPEDATVESRTSGGNTDPVMIRAQVMLDRAHFSPGVIDGRNGENVRNALAAFERARGLNPDGVLDAQVWAALSEGDANPAVRGYQIAEADVRGPFTAEIPSGFPAMAELERLGYRDAAEALAEKFHMDEDLLRELNPGVDFGRTGQVILVAAVGDTPLPAEVDRIDVDKDLVQVRAYAGDRLVAVYPATVGSGAFPSPEGAMTVQAVAPAPTYTYNPEVITFGRERNGDQVLTIAAGPNNPVGSTWIDLSEPTYGIHGAPEPQDVGKTASHGCVRLTNWDVAELGRAVRTGARVSFVGTRTGGERARPAAAATPTRS